MAMIARVLRKVAPTALAAAAGLLAMGAFGQEYPAKVVRVIVPFAPGGGSDITARQISLKLSEHFKRQFVVDNRGGASGLIGMELTVKSPPDGYTIMVMSGSFAATPATHKPAFDPINNIVPVAEMGYTPFVLSVHPSLPVKTTKELLALVKARPGQLNYVTPGVGSLTHLATELLINMTKTNMVGIAYKSTGAALPDLLSGQIQLIVGSILPTYPHIQSGKLRALAVTTAKRWYSLPNVPTLSDALPGYEVELWFGVMAPRGTPPAVIGTLNAAVNRIIHEPEMKANLEAQGMIASGGTPQRFGERIRKDYDRWVKVVREQNIKPE
jgi:tripartite-type tricarboxylate transporter receptor subunit TctC